MAFEGGYRAVRLSSAVFVAVLVLVFSGGPSNAAPSYDQHKTPQLADNIAAFPFTSCYFARNPQHPGEKHCDHVVKGVASTSRLKLLRRTQNITCAATSENSSHYGVEPTLSLVNARTVLILAKPRSPFKAMFAITTSMLN